MFREVIKIMKEQKVMAVELQDPESKAEIKVSLSSQGLISYPVESGSSSESVDLNKSLEKMQRDEERDEDLLFHSSQ